MDYMKDEVLIEGLKNHEDRLLRNETSEDHVHLEQNSVEDFVYNQSINCDEYDDFNNTLDYVPYMYRVETYIVPILFAIIFVIGILGNGTLIAIFLKHRTMRNVPNMYIVSLAVGDLLVIFFCVPFTSTVYTVESWPYGVVVCKFSEFIKDLSIGVSVFTLTALSADRYFAIVDPMRKLHGRRATRITCITIAGIWMLSIVMALPSAAFSYIRAIDNEASRIFYVCYPFPPELGKYYPQVMIMLRFLAYYAIPLSFIGTFYIIMARHLVLSTRNMPGEAQGQAKQIQARKKVAKMILSFVVIFAICFFPSHLFLLWFYFDPDAEDNFNGFWMSCRIIGFCLSFFNSCINPITLYCVSGTFRKQFNEHLFCCLCDAEGRSHGGRRRAGFGCGCVSLSGAGPGAPMYSQNGDYRFRNGYSTGQGLYRGSTTNSGGGTIKRKSTWDTQSTMSHHMYNLAVNIPAGQSPQDTPTSNTTPADTLIYQSASKHSNSTQNSVNSSVTTTLLTNLNSSYPVTHHPYQKDYQEYMNRINALEKGDPPPKSSDPLRVKSVKSKECQRLMGAGPKRESFVDSAKTSKLLSLPQSPGEVDDTPEYTVTSFISIPPSIKAGDPERDSVADKIVQNNNYD